MGKVYSAPKSIKLPEFKRPFNYEEYSKQVDEYVQEVCDYAKKNGRGKFAGKVVSFQVADGYARYVVMSLRPVTLIHLDDGDGYHFLYANRLASGDVKELIEQQENLKKFLANRA